MRNAEGGWLCGLSQGLPFVFYPKAESWDSSDVIAYARSHPRSTGIVANDDALKHFIDKFHNERLPNYKGSYVNTLKTQSGEDAVSFHFTCNKCAEREASVYCLEKNAIDFVSIRARTEEEFRAALPTMDGFAESYDFQNDKIPSDL